MRRSLISSIGQIHFFPHLVDFNVLHATGKSQSDPVGGFGGVVGDMNLNTLFCLGPLLRIIHTNIKLVYVPIPNN